MIHPRQCLSLVCPTQVHDADCPKFVGRDCLLGLGIGQPCCLIEPVKGIDFICWSFA